MKKFNCFYLVLLFNVSIALSNSYLDIKKGLQPNKGFEENKGHFSDLNGETTPDVFFRFSKGNTNVFLTKTGLVIQTFKLSEDEEAETRDKKERKPGSSKKQENVTVEWERFDIDLVGAKISSDNIVKENGSTFHQNYFLPHCKDGVYDVKMYSKITVKNTLTNIDWVLYVNENGELKYDFIVHPGGDFNNIKLVYRSKQPVTINSKHQTLVRTQYGDVIDDAPLSYCNGIRIETKYNAGISKRIVVGVDKGYETMVNFNVAIDSNLKHDLVIDPTLSWSTFFGGLNGDGFDGPCAATTDSNNNLYITGYVSSNPDFPLIDLGSGSYFQGTHGAVHDIFISKFNSAGVLLWSTFYGGSNFDEAYAIATDQNDNIFITGYTKSNNFPVYDPASGAHFQGTRAGFDDIIILKFSSSGIRLWATYYGGTGYDVGNSIAVNSLGEVLIGGYARGASNNIPLLNPGGGVFYNTVGDALLAKFSNTGVLLWGTKLAAYEAIAVITDMNDKVYVTGSAYLDPLVVTNPGAGAYVQTANASTQTPGAYFDAFIYSFSNSGTIQWATYFGGAGDDIGYSLAVDNCNNLILSGETNSPNLPVINSYSGAYYNNSALGGKDCFVAKFSKQGVQLYTSYLGGNGDDLMSDYKLSKNSICDSHGNLFLAFNTLSTNITTQAPIDGGYLDNTGTSISANSDLFIMSFSQFFSLQWSTYLGGDGKDSRSQFAIDNNDNLYMVGEWREVSNSSTYPVVDPGSGAYYDPLFQLVTLAPDDGYIVKFTTNMPIMPPPVINSLTQASPLCNNNTNGSVTVNASGTATLTYTWSNGNSGATIVNLSPATYTVTVIDGNGCCVTQSTTISSSPTININSTGITAASCGQNNGSASVIASGGSGSLTYSWSNTQSGQTATGLAATTYTVTVNDGNNCTNTSIVSVANLSGATATLSAASILCNSGSATVTATASGGNTPYTYLWSNSASTTTNSTTSTQDLTANNYTVTITDGNNCSSISTITLSQPTPIATNTISVSSASCGLSNGAAVVSATGGSGSLVYTWSNTQTGPTIINQPQGNYVVTVTDGNNCTNTLSVNIGITGGASFASSTVTNASCNGGTGSATVNITGGVSGIYTYSWASGQSSTTSSTTHQINNLSAGNYTVSVIDGTCSATTMVTIAEPTVISFTTINTYTTSCGTSNGGANVSAIGGTGTLNYSWSNTTSGQTISNVNAGTYIVSVTDANACIVSTNVFVNNTPSASIDSVKVQNVTCNGLNNGSATVYASGGAGSLIYTWSNATSGQTASNLQNGAYVISVTDGSGCLTQSNVVITQPQTINVLSANATSATCGLNNGGASIEARGGTGSEYTYSWSNGTNGATSGQSTITNLSANIYYCTVTDQNNCSYVHTFTIGDKPSPTFASASPVITPVPCKGSANATVTVNINSSNSPFTYTWSNGLNTSNTSSTTDTQNNLSAGTYTISVIDNNSCVSDTVITITEPQFNFTSSATSTGATCTTNGSIAVNISGGNTGDYTYSWISGQATVNSQQYTIINMQSGNYTITISDSKGCSTTTTATVTSPPNAPIVQSINITDVSCNGSTDGSAQVVIAGNGTTYTYSWSNGTSSTTNSTTLTTYSLTANSYSLTVTDNNGCSTTTTAIITQPQLLSASSISGNTTCGNDNGSVQVSVSGGNSGNYTYSWTSGQSTVNNIQYTIGSLQSGNYTITVVDSKNCTSISSTTVNATPLPIATASASQTTITEGSSTQLSASGGTTYLWNPNTGLSCTVCASPTANPTTTTAYTVIVTDANACNDTTYITINVEKLPDCDGIYLPTAFSPNKDGENDVLYVRGNEKCIKELLFQVFDRWGQNVFETAEITTGWNGQFKGRDVDSGVFVFRLLGSYTSGEKIDQKGNVTLLR